MISRRSVLAAGLGSALATTLTGCGPSTWLLGAFSTPGVSDPTPGETPDLASHLLARCTFGPRPGERALLLDQGSEAWIESQLEAGPDRALARVLDDLSVLHAPAAEAYEFSAREVQEQLVRGALLRALYGRNQLQAVVASCWRDQFNVGAGKGECGWLVASYEREVILRHALGNFRDLLRASITHPAMLWYLDGRTNRREHPNENHARELLELHGLGADAGYTQADVQEVARCLTGWTVRPKTGFRKTLVEFDPSLHDDGPKVVLGVSIVGSGAEELDVVVERILAHPACAQRVARRLCRRFIADEPPAAVIADVAAVFRATNGDLRATVRAVLTHAAFRTPDVRGIKFKRPLHWLASCLRALEVRTLVKPWLAETVERLGEAPWQHPTPDGYPEAAVAWTGTVWWRWRTAQQLAEYYDQELDPAQVLGRQPTASERSALAASSEPRARRALVLAMPAHMRC